MPTSESTSTAARAAPRIAAGVFVLSAVFALASTVLWLDPASALFPWAVVGLGFLGLVVVRRTANPIGWVLLVASVAGTLAVATESYVLTGAERPGLPGVQLAGWLNSVSFSAISTAYPLLFLLFPTGRPPSRRWRPVLAAWAAGAALVVTWAALQPVVFQHRTLPDVSSPFDLALPPGVLATMLNVGVSLSLGTAALSIAALVLRFRRARGDERVQMKWVVLVAMSAAGLFAFMAIVDLATADAPTGVLDLATAVAWISFVLLLAAGIPVAMAVAILRYRLYDIDLVIRKTVIFGILVVLIMTVAIGTLLAVSSPITDRAPEETQAVGIAMLIVGVLVWPLRRLAVKIADRLVYGGRSTPYEVLTTLAGRLSETYATDDVLPRLATALGEATGARSAHVWLRVGDELRDEARWPSGEPAPARRLGGDALPHFEAGFTAEVRHQGELLGALVVTTSANDPMTPAKEKLVHDLAAQAGLVLRNVRLIEELRASRQRLVAAQDEERRRIERNIHDGAQQQLVALAVKLRLAEQLTERDPAKAREMLGELQVATTEALEDLRDLARGIYPPLLADRGLALALEAQARKSPLPVRLDADGLARHPPDVETAVYFCVLEALQNAAKYADASDVAIRLEDGDGRLRFEVVDDGRGFRRDATELGTGLQGMADRLEALGGRLEVESAPGSGTVVRGWAPVRGAS